MKKLQQQQQTSGLTTYILDSIAEALMTTFGMRRWVTLKGPKFTGMFGFARRSLLATPAVASLNRHPAFKGVLEAKIVSVSADKTVYSLGVFKEQSQIAQLGFDSRVNSVVLTYDREEMQDVVRDSDNVERLV